MLVFGHCRFIPNKHKQDIVTTLFNRVRRICTEDTVERELANLRSTLEASGYPSAFIKRYENHNKRQQD